MPLNSYGVQQVLLAGVSVGLLRSSSGASLGHEYAGWLEGGLAECAAALGYDTISREDIQAMARRANAEAADGVRYGSVGADWAAMTFAAVKDNLVSQGGSANLFDEIRNNWFPSLRQADVDSAEAYGYAWGMDNPF